jgi:Kef-type K+ transport system membrane component KefB
MAHDAKIPDLDAKGLRSFGVSTGAIVAVLFGLLLPWLFGRAFPVWPWVVFAVLAAWALLAPRSLRLVYRYWMKLGLLLSRVTTPIVLGVVFFLVVAPMGLIRRAFGHDAMARVLDDAAPSYRTKSRDKGSNKLENPY